MLETRQIVLITGCRKGIGRALAEHYLNQGFEVIGCSRSPSDLIHERYHHYLVDVCKELEVKRLFKSVRQRFGRLDALINNAGIASMNHFMLTPAATAEAILMTNVLGTFLFSREAAKLMKNRGGNIINLSSVAVPMKLEGEAIYAASKAAVVCLTQILAKELAPFSIRVNAIAAPPVRTDLVAGVDETKLKNILSRMAIGRMAETCDLAAVTDYFLRADSSMITGQIITPGGV